MGLFAQLSFLGLYVLYSRAWKPEREILWLVMVCAGVIAGLAVRNRYGIRPFLNGTAAAWDETSLSTIGNMNWFCGYLSVLRPLVLVLYTNGKERIQRMVLGVLTFLLVMSGIVQGSESGYLILASSVLVLYLAFARNREGMELVRKGVRPVWLGVLAVSLLQELFPGRITYVNRFTWIFQLQYMLPAVFLWAAGEYLWIKRMEKRSGEDSDHRCGRLRTAIAVLLAVVIAGGGALLLTGSVWGKETFPSFLVMTDG